MNLDQKRVIRLLFLGVAFGSMFGCQLLLLSQVHRWQDLAHDWENMDKITSDSLLVTKQALAWCQDPTRGNLKSGSTAYSEIIHVVRDGKSFICPADADFIYCVPDSDETPHSRE